MASVAVASSARYIIAHVFWFVNPFLKIFLNFFIACRRKDDFCCGVRVCGLREKKTKKISVFFNFGVDIWGEIAYNNFRTKRNGELCNGSTYDSDSYCLGSNPSSPANGSMVKRLRRRPLKAKSGVRFPLELPVKSTVAKAAVFFYAFLRYCSFGLAVL